MALFLSLDLLSRLIDKQIFYDTFFEISLKNCINTEKIEGDHLSYKKSKNF